MQNQNLLTLLRRCPTPESEALASDLEKSAVAAAYRQGSPNLFPDADREVAASNRP